MRCLTLFCGFITSPVWWPALAEEESHRAVSSLDLDRIYKIAAFRSRGNSEYRVAKEVARYTVGEQTTTRHWRRLTTSFLHECLRAGPLPAPE